MRNLFILTISIVIFVSCGHNNPRFGTYPKVGEIEARFDSTFHVVSAKNFYFTLAKKPKGWYVVKMDSKNMKPLGEELFWDAGNNTYQKISRNFFNSTDLNEWGFSMKTQIRGEDYSFDHSIYFGYEGWENDVIDELGGSADLNDTLLESLARAYESKCSKLSRDSKGDQNSEPKPMSEAEMKDFIAFGKKDLETNERLIKLNPEYKTIVGKIGNKYSNEHLFLWSELMQAGKEKEAEQFLTDGLYDELMINFAKNMLNSAEKNAIIFTNGDNDTYPLWYAQFKLGVRKDVAVMNMSLMNIPAWLLSDKKNYGFELNIADKFYLDKKSELMYLGDNDKSVFGMNTLYAGLNQNDPAFQVETDGGSTPNCPFKNIRLSTTENDSLAPVVKLKGSYLLRSEIAILDIISSNLEKRPVYFAQTSSGIIPDGLFHNIVCEGKLNKVVQEGNQGTMTFDRYYNLDIFYKNLMSNYSFGMEGSKSLSVEEIGRNYVIDFHTLSVAYLEKGDTAKSMEVAEACISKINFAVFPDDEVVSYLIGDDLCRGGKTQDGHKYLAMAFEVIRANYQKENNTKTLDDYGRILEYIAADGTKYGFVDLVNPVGNLKKSVDEKARKLSGGKDADL